MAVTGWHPWLWLAGPHGCDMLAPMAVTGWPHGCDWLAPMAVTGWPPGPVMLTLDWSQCETSFHTERQRYRARGWGGDSDRHSTSGKAGRGQWSERYMYNRAFSEERYRNLTASPKFVVNRPLVRQHLTEADIPRSCTAEYIYIRQFKKKLKHLLSV
jgi:hypothetical protein